MLSPSAPHCSPPVEWLTLKINSVISNKLLFLFLLHSISSGDRLVLVAISFHNTVEQGMHNAEDVRKMNVLTNARALGRLIRKVQFSYLQEFSFTDFMCLCLCPLLEKTCIFFNYFLVKPHVRQEKKKPKTHFSSSISTKYLTSNQEQLGVENFWPKR